MKIGDYEVNKKLFIAFIIIVALCVISLIFKMYLSGRENRYKVDKDREYIYRYDYYSASKTNIPYINIDTDFVNNLNTQIQKIGLSYKNSQTSNNSMSYRFNQYQNILSLVLIFKSLNSNNELQFEFKTYVFDLNDGGRVLTDKEMLNLFNLNMDEVNDILNTKMKKKYNDEVKKKIIPSNICAYSDCYLRLRGINNFLDGANYYIENGKLIVYRSFNTYSVYEEEKYFTRDDFKFVVSS